MQLRGKKLGILISAAPEAASYGHGVRLAETAVAAGVQVYLYLIDEGVKGASDPRLSALQTQGLRFFACAYGAQRRDLPLRGSAVFGGLTIVADLISATDRFVSFN